MVAADSTAVDFMEVVFMADSIVFTADFMTVDSMEDSMMDSMVEFSLALG